MSSTADDTEMGSQEGLGDIVEWFNGMVSYVVLFSYRSRHTISSTVSGARGWV